MYQRNNRPPVAKRKIIFEENNDRREWFTWGVSMKYRLLKLRQYMRGWISPAQNLEQIFAE